MDGFNQSAEFVIDLAESAAKDVGQTYVGSEHLLFAMYSVVGVAMDVLSKHVDEGEFYNNLVSLAGTEFPGKRKRGRLPKTDKLLKILDASKEIAKKCGESEAGTPHLLLAILRDNDCVAVRILNTMHVDLSRLYVEVLSTIGYDKNQIRQEMMSIKNSGAGSILEQYTRDLTALAKEGRLDPVIGRREEIKRVLEILCRRTKNNPVLLGEPGVGKTAIVEGIAGLIAEGLVPDILSDCRIMTLDLSGLVAGTKYRGEFEERIKRVMNEVINAGNIILFLDEIHTLIGAGSAEGTLDAANILKPALSRGELRVIGATTKDEYRKRIEKDAALARRFQEVSVEEPDEEMSIEILMGLRDRLSAHHKVTIEDEAIVSAVKLSARYVADRYLPDKAIDCIDEACSKAKLSGFKLDNKAGLLEEERRILASELDEAFSDGDNERYEELYKKKQDIDRKLKRLKSVNSSKKKIVVTKDWVAEVVSAQSKVPVARLKESENARLLKLEETLHKRVIGQSEAVLAVAKAIRRGKAGVKDPNRPIGSFLFLGPTGVGKTELSKALAEAMFGKESAIIRVDMSEYMEKHSVSKMIGSPPGYVGHEEGGQLSEQVRQKPYSIILFDEIEKAHPDVFNVLLQVLDEGRITDSQGRTVSFKNTIIIMTSNAGAQSIVNPKQLGFSKGNDEKKNYEFMKNAVMEEVRRIFKPEFINRIDDIIVFHELTKDELADIVKLMLGTTSKRLLEDRGIKLKMSKALIEHIAEKGYDPKYGARPIKRAILEEVEDRLADGLISGEFKDGSLVRLDFKNGRTELLTE